MVIAHDVRGVVDILRGGGAQCCWAACQLCSRYSLGALAQAGP